LEAKANPFGRKRPGGVPKFRRACHRFSWERATSKIAKSQIEFWYGCPVPRARPCQTL